MSLSDIVYTAEGQFNTKSKRIKAFQRNRDLQSVPASYLSSSVNEELCFEYVKSYVSEFRTVYPKRREPFLLAKNEHGVDKFVCSTITPSLSQFTELYDLHECAVFFAGYVVYEPLDPPAEAPAYLPSPGQTLAWHTGDSFDMATLLCSLLLGNGYDAYVVHGYAPKFIALRDQSTSTCPIISKLDQASNVRAETTDDIEDDSDNNPYKIPEDTLGPSKFIEKQRELARIRGLDKFVLWGGSGIDLSTPAPAEDGVERAHAWVMVRSGRREIKETTFIEPSTGRAYPASNSPYLAVEAMWNNQNFWINTDLKRKVGDLDFSLSAENGFWEYLFISSTRGVTPGGIKPSSGGDADVGDMRAGSSSRDGEDSPRGIRSASNEDKLDLGGDGSSMERTLDPPPAWAKEVVVDRSMYLNRYPPNGKRTVNYLRAKVDYYARTTHPQAMVMRMVLYLDNSRKLVSEIHEWFESRRDKMYKRARYVIQGYFTEFYQPGSSGEIKQWTEYPGKKIFVDYYVKGRPDFLRRREEYVGHRVKEFYQGRNDRLNYMSVHFSSEKLSVEPRAGMYELSGGTLAKELYISKMVQCYDPDPANNTGTAVSRRSYFIVDGKVVTEFHYAPSKVTRKMKVYVHPRAGMVNAAINDDHADNDDTDGAQEVNQMERECYNFIRKNFELNANLLRVRAEVEGDVGQERTVFEIALDRAKNGDMGTMGPEGSTDNDAKAVDYLTPFLRHLKETSKLSREDAIEVRQACLDSLKNRLVERANIIQSRLNDENTKLAKKQEKFQRSQRDGDVSTEEYEKYCTEAMFRIQILEQRLVQHEEAALKKFAELDLKLANDPRLRALRNG